MHNILRKSIRKCVCILLVLLKMIIDIYVSPEAIKYAPGLYFINTHKTKGFLLQPDWSEKYNKHIKKREHIELSFVWFILKVFQRHKRNHNFYSTACQHISYKNVCLLFFWFVLVKENQDEEFHWGNCYLILWFVPCNNWLLMRGGFINAIIFEKFIVLYNCKMLL